MYEKWQVVHMGPVCIEVRIVSRERNSIVSDKN